MLKVIFTDLDDTFLYDYENAKNNMYNVPQKSKDAYNEIVNSGIKFVIATGRLYGEVVELVKRNDLDCDLIVMDGCVAFDKDTHMLTDYQGISNEDTLEMMKLFDSNDIPYFICDDRNYYGLNYQWVWLEQAIKDNDLEVTRIIVHGDKNVTDKAIKILGNYSEKFEIFEYPTNIVIQNKNTSKGQAILRYIEKHNINLDEIAVFGDGINDESMFALNTSSVFIKHGKSQFSKENAKYVANDFAQGWELLKKEYNLK